MDNSRLIAKLGARTQHQQCVPLISHYVTSAQLFAHRDKKSLFLDPFLSAAWAKDLDYPMLEDQNILPRVAQYAYIVTYQRDDFDSKIAYLDFIKKTLIQEANDLGLADPVAINITRGNADQLSIADIAMTLNMVDVGPESDNVLALLARMPFEVYLTTTPFTLLEEALKENGKPDYVSACYHWHGQDTGSPNVGRNYVPSIERPLVYHLQGIDSDPVSLVFTEDDYFEFFKRLAQDLRNEVQSDNRLPPVIAGLLGSKSLILLGYSLYDWSFRSFFRGPFRNSVNTRTRSVSAQFPPEGDPQMQSKVREYLTEFFKEDKFDLYWGSIDQFSHELIAVLEG